MIVIIDYGAGNLHSVQKAVEKCGAAVAVTQAPDDLARAEKVIFPGVGAFGKAAESLQRLGFYSAIRRYVETGRPFLGICLGMQMLFELSEESPGAEGLGLLCGTVRRLPSGVKAPHLGWNAVRQTGASPLWKEVPDGAYFYFAHSFYVDPAEKECVVGVTDYGGEIAVAVRRGNLFGVQFHPEKSQKLGLQVLKNFVALTPTSAEGVESGLLP
ncbi:MAG: imidazole glycerol phosphate synthase subunit HisH [candidate division KSB1 bacterium]|nr:imidazole glycerol phosphate synthase subunit HisH [candidate division KSB1 bacterium]